MKGYIIISVITTVSALATIHEHRASKRALEDKLSSLQAKKKQLDLESRIGMSDVTEDIHKTKAELSETKRAIGKHTMHQVFLMLILPISIIISAATAAVVFIPKYYPGRAYYTKAITGIATTVLIILVIVWYYYHAV